MYKRILIPVGIILGACIGVYFTYFHRPPTSDILAANRQRREHVPDSGKAASDLKDDYDYEEEEEDVAPAKGPQAAKMSYRKWQHFMDQNDLVSIGELYDSCGESFFILHTINNCISYCFEHNIVFVS